MTLGHHWALLALPDTPCLSHHPCCWYREPQDKCLSPAEAILAFHPLPSARPGGMQILPECTCSIPLRGGPRASHGVPGQDQSGKGPLWVPVPQARPGCAKLGCGQHGAVPRHDDEEVQPVPRVSQVALLPEQPQRDHLDDHLHREEGKDEVIEGLEGGEPESGTPALHTRRGHVPKGHSWQGGQPSPRPPRPPPPGYCSALSGTRRPHKAGTCPG